MVCLLGKAPQHRLSPTGISKLLESLRLASTVHQCPAFSPKKGRAVHSVCPTCVQIRDSTRLTVNSIKDEELNERIATFKRDLIRFDAIEISRRHIVFGECAVIDPDEYFRLRSVVARRYDLHPNDVLVVGSGKLGFSIAPSKQYRPFSDESDLDVVIISERLFDIVWQDVHRYFNQGGYWEHANAFQQYLFRGWLRPDKLPPDHKFPFGKAWWEFFNHLSASREYSISRIRGAIYRNWYFLEAYQELAISECARQLIQQQEMPYEN